MRTWWMLLALAACPAPNKPIGPKLDIAATATATLDRDAAAMLELVRALYLEVGITVADNLTLELGKLDDTDSEYDDSLIRITLPTPITSPDQADAYWQAWGKLTATPVEQSFTDDVLRYRLARFHVFATLAHEVGQFLHHSYMGPLEPAARELVADRLAVAILERLAVRPELRALVTKYRALLAAWYAAIPSRVEIPVDADLDRWVAEHPLPSDPAALVSLSLARQLRLFAKPPKLADLAKTLLANPPRKLEYGTGKLVVTTGRDVPAGFTRVIASSGSMRELATAVLDAEGRFHRIACSIGTCEITNEAGEARTLVLANVLGEFAGFERVHDLAIQGDKLWLLLAGDGEQQPAALAIIDLARPDGGKPAATWQGVTSGRLAVSPSGAASVMLLRANQWTIERLDTRGPSWTFRVGEADADGPDGVAGGTLGDCTSNDAGTIYCAAGFRIRVLDKDRLWTLAGGNRDWVDATDAKKVAFTHPVRLRATKTGLVLVDRKYGEDGKPSWKVRQIELKK